MQYLYPNTPLKYNEKHFFDTWSVLVVWPTLNGVVRQNEEEHLLVFMGMFPVCFLWRIWGVNIESLRRAGGLATLSLRM